MVTDRAIRRCGATVIACFCLLCGLATDRGMDTQATRMPDTKMKRRIVNCFYTQGRNDVVSIKQDAQEL